MCPAGAVVYRDERFPTEAMTPTVAVGQVRFARTGRERADGKRSTEGKQMGSEAGCVGVVASNTKARKSSKNASGKAQRRERKETAPTWGDLGRESGAGVSRGHSSVGDRANKHPVERRAEERKEQSSMRTWKGSRKRPETARRDNYGRHLGLANARPSGGTAASGRSGSRAG